MATPQPQSILDQNKALAVRWFDEVWNHGRVATIHELFGVNCVLHDGAKNYRGPEEFLRFYNNLRAQFSQFSVKPIEKLAENDLVSIHWSVHCVHTASGTPIHLTGMSLVRIEDGQFAEAWQNWDEAGVATQLLATPSPD